MYPGEVFRWQRRRGCCFGDEGKRWGTRPGRTDGFCTFDMFRQQRDFYIKGVRFRLFATIACSRLKLEVDEKS